MGNFEVFLWSIKLSINLLFLKSDIFFNIFSVTVFSTKDRAHLLNDAFKLAESRHLSYSIPLSMTEYLTNEKSLIPWKTLYSEFVSMENSLEKTETYPLYRKVFIIYIK